MALVGINFSDLGMAIATCRPLFHSTTFTYSIQYGIVTRWAKSLAAVAESCSSLDLTPDELDLSLAILGSVHCLGYDWPTY